MRKPNYRECGHVGTPTTVPCDVRMTSRGVQLMVVGEVDKDEQSSEGRDQDSDLEGIIMSKDQKTRDRLRGIIGEVEKMRNIVPALEEGRMIMACDGSMKEQKTHMQYASEMT